MAVPMKLAVATRVVEFVGWAGTASLQVVVVMQLSLTVMCSVGANYYG
ncbi:hypothetical protein BN844_3526 [Pseudomonas sp. SHC52]|nr:hypothetical protein BN844_3526 [Pseudomonas sp. SHC52]